MHACRREKSTKQKKKSSHISPIARLLESFVQGGWTPTFAPANLRPLILLKKMTGPACDRLRITIHNQMGTRTV
jgi:hypothetical protein